MGTDSDVEEYVEEMKEYPIDNDSEKPEKIEQSVELSGVARFLFLTAASFLLFGNFYVIEIPASITSTFKTEYQIDQVQYGMLNSAYSLPNIILPFIYGWLTDAIFGFRIGGIIAGGCIFLGQLVWAGGSHLTPNGIAFYLAMLGRGITGLGGPALIVIRSGYLSKWFRSKELSLAFAVAMSGTRIASSVAFYVTPWVDDYFALSATLWVGSFFCLISFFCCFLVAFLDKKWNDDTFKSSRVNLKDIVKLPITFWLLTLILTSFYVGVSTYTIFTSAEFMHIFSFSKEKASSVTSIVYTIAVVLFPVSGFILDKTGRHIYFIIAAAIGLLFTHAFMIMVPSTFTFAPIISMIITGVCYSLGGSAVWPLTGLLVDHKVIGTAYGILMSFQSCGLLVGPIIVGWITNDAANPNYQNAEIFFGCIAILCLMLCLLIVHYDSIGNKVLVSSAKTQRRVSAENKQKEADAKEKL